MTTPSPATSLPTPRPTSRPWDVIVLGLGAMGSATALQLARRGCRVLGFDRFSPPHTQGSTHGESRIIREAYFESPLYVPLVQRAYELWAELERESGARLFVPTGGLMIGPRDSEIVAGARHSAEQHRLPHEILAAPDVRRRFPALQPPDDWLAVWEARAGVLFPERCVEAQLRGATARGAELHVNEPVERWAPDGDGVRVWTARGEYSAGALVITAGAWLGQLAADLRLPLRVERQVLFWFDALANPADFRPDRCPVHIWEYEPGKHFYGLPDVGTGSKLAVHHEGPTVSPDAVDRTLGAAETRKMQSLVRRHLPGLNPAVRSFAVCLYTDTPDQHFLIDRHPEHPQVWLGSPCSGHGFKFASAVGEVLADLALTGRSRMDLELFRLGRW
ncbi:N-methyltryptophan oxidase [Verrucomicrobiota bacterium]|nr:N-methyltryptophan oxidase [Verrucomicrobiota bacterium]